MKKLNNSAMENIQGGYAGAISIGLPLTAVLGALGLGSILALGLGAGLTVAYNIELPALPTLPTL